MGRMSDLHIELTDKYYAKEQNDLPYKRSKKPESKGLVQDLRDELAFYKERFEWERARVYKAWHNNPEVKKKLAYKRRWKK